MDSSYEAITRWCIIIYSILWLCTRRWLLVSYVRGVLVVVFLGIGLRKVAVSACAGQEIKASELFWMLKNKLWFKSILLGVVFSFLWIVPVITGRYIVDRSLNLLYCIYYYAIYLCTELASVIYIQNPDITFKNLFHRLFSYRSDWWYYASQQAKEIWRDVVIYVFLFLLVLFVDYTNDSNITSNEFAVILSVSLFIVGPKFLLKTTCCVLNVLETINNDKAA